MNESDHDTDALCDIVSRAFEQGSDTRYMPAACNAAREYHEHMTRWRTIPDDGEFPEIGQDVLCEKNDGFFELLAWKDKYKLEVCRWMPLTIKQKRK